MATPLPLKPPVGRAGETVLYVPYSRARLYSLVVSVLLLFSVLGYPIVGAGASLYFVESREFAVAFRMLVLLCSVAAIGLALARLPARATRFLPAAMTILLILYSLRLIVDAFSGQFPDIGEASLYFYGTCVIPAIGVCVLSAFRDPHRDAPLFLVVGGLLCATILFTTQGELSTAADIAQGQGRLFLTRLNPISIGHVGVTTVIAAMALYFEPGHARWLKWLIVPFSGAAIACLIYAGSRGPLISLVGAVMALLVFQRRWWLLIGLAVIGLIWAVQITSYESTLLDRLMAIGSDQSSTQRLDIQGLALDQFLAHPVTGSAYVELVFGFNPHNMILESAMALGVVGLALMLWIWIRAGLVAVGRMGQGELMLPLLVIQYLVAVQFSGSITASNEFWVCTALLLVTAHRRVRRLGSAPEASAGPQRPPEN